MCESAKPIVAEMRIIGEATRAEALQNISAPERDLLLSTLTAMKLNLMDACRLPVEERKLE